LDATEGNVLNNFPRGSVAVNGGRALLGKFASAMLFLRSLALL
jgi:hypothetical protein